MEVLAVFFLRAGMLGQTKTTSDYHRGKGEAESIAFSDSD